jgi:hypothetical protein
MDYRKFIMRTHPNKHLKQFQSNVWLKSSTLAHGCEHYTIQGLRYQQSESGIHMSSQILNVTGTDGNLLQIKSSQQVINS